MPEQDISILRGIEGARMKTACGLLAQKYRIDMRIPDCRYRPTNVPLAYRRRAARTKPSNHLAATAIEGARMKTIAYSLLAATGTLPPLSGFIHKDASDRLLNLDIADAPNQDRSNHSRLLEHHMKPMWPALL